MKRDVTLVFDFDGTIIDSADSVFRIGNKLASEFGYQPVGDNEIEILRGKGSREVFKAMHIPLYKAPKILKRVREELAKELETLVPVIGMPKVLRSLRKKGFTLAILTSNSQETVRKFIERNGLDIFSFIYSGSSLFGKDKVIKKMLKEKKLDREKVIYVGDETRDIEASRKCRVRITAVTWGIFNREVLSLHRPDWIIDKPEQLLALKL